MEERASASRLNVPRMRSTVTYPASNARNKLERPDNVDTGVQGGAEEEATQPPAAPSQG